MQLKVMNIFVIICSVLLFLPAAKAFETHFLSLLGNFSSGRNPKNSEFENSPTFAASDAFSNLENVKSFALCILLYFMSWCIAFNTFPARFMIKKHSSYSLLYHPIKEHDFCLHQNIYLVLSILKKCIFSLTFKRVTCTYK